MTYFVKTVFHIRHTTEVTGKFRIPKTYKSMILPAGEYYGVRIVLGSGEGHNWWCVMYPPLCFKEGEEVRLSKESEKILREKH